MKRVVRIATVIGIAAAANAVASETKPLTLQLRPKAALTSTAPNPNYAPFLLAASGDPELDLLPRRDLRSGDSRSGCNKQQALCYDAASGRIEFRPARNLMPDIPGLQRETISVKRDRIILKYSF
jgi:hypothetical protein